MRTAELARRLCLSFLVGLYLLAAVLSPARAIIPAGVYAGTIIRGIIAGAGTRAAIPAAGNAAKALSASGLFGVSAAAYIVMCGSNYVSGNDCSGTPLAKLRPQTQTGNDGETASVTIAATSSQGYYIPSCSGPPYYATGLAACQAAYSGCLYINPVSQPVGYGDAGSGTVCTFNDSGSRIATSTGVARGGTVYTCPAGYNVSGSNCVPVTEWASDGVPSYRNQAGAWVADPKDPDTAAPLANPYVVDRLAPDGQPMKIEITANADGSIRMRTFTQTQASGQTATNVNDITITSGGTSTATTNIYYGDTTTVYNQTAPTVQTPAPQIELPTDYQRDATGQQTNTKLQTIITDGLKVKEEGVPASEALDAGKTAYQDAAKAREDALPNITSPTGKQTSWAWNLALPTGCSPLNVDMRVGSIGRIVTLDPCAYQATIHELVSMCWAATTLFLVFGMVGRTLREV